MTAPEPPITPATCPALAAIARASRKAARVPVAALLAGLDADAAGAMVDGLADLDEARLVDPWPGDDGEAVCLTGLGARACGLRLKVDERAKDGAYRWVSACVPDVQRPRMHHPDSSQLETDLGIRLDHIIGECAPDAARMIDAVEAYRRGRGSLGAIEDAARRGFFMLGAGAPWEPSTPHDPGTTDHCPVCHGRPRTMLDYCPRCDRSGIDDLLPKVQRLPVDPKPRGPGRPPGGHGGPPTRKQKRDDRRKAG